MDRTNFYDDFKDLGRKMELFDCGINKSNLLLA